MPIQPGRLTADHCAPVVVFLIGVRINRFLAPGKWLPVLRAMPRMLDELTADPDSGFIGAQQMLAGARTLMLVQYWRDFERLEAYARDGAREHWPAWREFNKAAKGNVAVGIFHETYCVAEGGLETIYVDMPPFGLGRFVGTVPATGSRQAAAERMKVWRGE